PAWRAAPRTSRKTRSLDSTSAPTSAPDFASRPQSTTPPTYSWIRTRSQRYQRARVHSIPLRSSTHDGVSDGDVLAGCAAKHEDVPDHIVKAQSLHQMERDAERVNNAARHKQSERAAR